MKKLRHAFRADNDATNDGLLVRQMGGGDSWPMMKMITEGAVGNTIDALRTDLDSHIHNSFVAIEPGGRMVGFILGDDKGCLFSDGNIGIINLVIARQQDNAQNCVGMLVRAIARHCLGMGQDSMELMAFNQDPLMAEICFEHEADKIKAINGIDRDDQEFEAIFYRIDNLQKRFAADTIGKSAPCLRI
jgi:hypothetical protein